MMPVPCFSSLFRSCFFYFDFKQQFKNFMNCFSVILGKRHRVYNDIILADARHLPFRRKSFDVILAAELVEHLEKKEGKYL